jgi:predicted AAA+ superfamily ATPase
VSLWNYVSVRQDVFDRELDEKVAPSLSAVVFGDAHKIYADPQEFIKITHLTDTVKRLVNEVIDAFATGAGKVIVLPSTFGGGKTHTMILLYHLVKRPDLLSRVFGEGASSRLRALEGLEVVVIDGFDKRIAPSPLPDEALKEGGLEIKTLWGYLAYKLGSYEKVRKYDEILTSPEKTTLSEVLAGKKVLILIDELGWYYNRLVSVPEPEKAKVFERYAEQVIFFLRVLSESVGGQSVVVVLSIPAEPAEEKLKAETGYERFIDRIEREVLRQAIRAERPIATDEDFASVLKKRLFEKIDSTGPQLASRRWASLSAENPSLVKDVRDEVEKFYPFHPLFITTLRELVEKNKDLQKTRDALRIARKVVRGLYEKVKELLLIMPTDIDPRLEEIRAKIITEKFLAFDLVLNKIVNKVKEMPVEGGVNPDVYRDLAYRLALYIFLRTYVYDPHLEPRSEFPSKSEVITGVYDPMRYEQYLISPVMLSELLDKLSSGGIEYRVPHLYGREGYYWVTRLLDIRERVEKEAEKVEDLNAKEYVFGEIEELYTRPYEGREQVKPSIFRPRPIVLQRPELLESDSPEYTLVIIATPFEDLKEGVYASGDLYDIIYYRLSGRQKAMRKYANTIAVLASNRASTWRGILKTAKMIVACRRLTDAIRREYRDEKIVKILKEDLKGMENDLSRVLKYKLVAEYFNLIAYPTVQNGTRVIRVERVGVADSRTLVELAEGALRDAGKILEEKFSRNFDVLVSYLEGIRGEPKWTRKMSVSSVTSAFYEDPVLPMVPREDIKEALLSGLRALKIGVLREGRVIFKEVEGVREISLRDTDEVIPQEEAAERQIEELSKVEEKVEGDLLIKRYYVAVYGDREIPVGELKAKYPDNYVKVFVDSRIELREEKVRSGFDFQLERREVEFRLDEAPEEVGVEILIKRVGAFEGEVVLKPEVGVVEPSSGVPDFKVVWRIPVPKEEGEHTYALMGYAKAAELTRRAEVKVILKKGLRRSSEPPERVSEVRVSGLVEAPILVKFLMAVSRSVQGPKIVRCCDLRVEFLEKRPEELERLVNVFFKNVTIDDVVKVVKALSGAFGVTASIKSEALQLEVVGEGKVVDMNELSSADKEIKQRQATVEYYW